MSRRSRNAVEKDLRKLHRRGLNDARLDDLGELLAVSRIVCNESTDRANVHAAVALAIDACWGGASEEGPSLRDAMRLWFGLSPCDDLSAADTSAMSSVERHTAAWSYWQTGAGAKESLQTFRTSKAAVRYEALAKKLIDLEMAAIETAETETRQYPAQLSAPALDDAGSGLSRSTTRTRQLIVAGTLAVIAGVLLLWHPWTTVVLPLPPRGAIVNAQTGSWTMRAAQTPARYPVGLGEGPSEFRACDVTIYVHCHFPATVPPLRPRLGDIVEFAVRLNDGYNGEVPYLKLEATVYTVGESSPARHKILPAAVELDVSLRVAFPSTTGEFGNGPVTARSPRLNDVYLYFNSPGRYGLQEVPGSSEIYNREVGFLHRLPDGIMDDLGIALQHLGEPPTCHPCAEKYIRYVRFRARVINSDSPGKRGSTGVG